ncbi:MAG: alkaline phosphatase family protein [Terriglobales bacterium]
MKHDKIKWPILRLLGLATLSLLLAGCRGLVAGDTGIGQTPPPPSGLQNINHIIFMAQENRGFDHYFGALRDYRRSHGFDDPAFDGLAQFNPVSGDPPLLGNAPTNPGCDPMSPVPADCIFNSNSPAVGSFHMLSMCIENPSPSWNESHVDWNLTSPRSPTATLDGFVNTAAHDARNDMFHDTDGLRAMSYYDGDDLPYYYFMASSFGTSDRWFSPIMTRTQANRMYLIAATSSGHVYTPTNTPLQNLTIFDELQAAGITWKIYVTDLDPAYAAFPIQDSEINYYAAAAKYPQNIVKVSDYFTDLTNGTLPQVSYIDAGLNSGLDEHPGVDEGVVGASIQVGAHYVTTVINALMTSSAWKDSVFILTYDEFGGFYEHVPPQNCVGPSPCTMLENPDGIPPMDLLQGPPPNGPDICVLNTGPTCDFVYTGYRIPLIVISPFSKKGYVSHTVADSTAWLKLVETRFNLKNLTKRDAVQMDMSEFFDFTNVPWKTPPAQIPDQPTNGPCYQDHLP